MSTGVIVLAAGRGTRMRTEVPKVLNVVAGRTMLGWALSALSSIEPDEIVVVVGHQAEEVAEYLGADERIPQGVKVAIQEPQNGTGHAVKVGVGGFTKEHDVVIVIPGDMPLLRPESIEGLLDLHSETDAAATILTTDLANPHGYGRVVRSEGEIISIVEESDATENERMIREVNTSVYAFDGELLLGALDGLSNDNSQGEYYLTDVVDEFVANQVVVSGFTSNPEEGLGVNSQSQLAVVGSILRNRINSGLLEAGVWMLDPERVYIDAGVIVAPGSYIYPDTYLTGETVIASGASIGPSSQIHDSLIGARSVVTNSTLTGVIVGKDVTIGPYTYLRPGTELKDSTKVGAHVEIKNSLIGEGSKVPHLSYIGDTTIGEQTNIGAATVTVNYDGYEKHRTTIGDRVKIGSDTMLVAPVSIGDDAYTGAGSVITRDVPEGSLGVERSPQKNFSGYSEKRRERAEAGTEIVEED